MQSVMLKLSAIEPNKGQIEGLPKNPRFIKDEKFKKLVKSIEDNPEMTAMRELLVIRWTMASTSSSVAICATGP